MTIKLKGLGQVAVAVGVIGVVSSMLLVPMSAAAETRSASSAIAELDVNAIPAVGVDAFSGSYGTAGTPDLSKSADSVNGDFSDPDRVLDHLTVNGTQISATDWESTTGQLTARTNATGFEVNYNGVDDFMTSGSIDSYARCLNNGGALAYARGDGSLAYVLGKPVSAGANTIEATGAQLNMPNVDTATLTVTVKRVENAVNTPTEVSAEAYFEIIVEGQLRDASGDVIYDGPMMTLIEGHVKVTCKPQREPTPSSSSATSSSASASPSSSSSSSASPSSSSPTSTSDSPTSSSSSASPTSPRPSPTSESPSPTSDSPSPSSESPSTSTHASPTTSSASPSSSSASPSSSTVSPSISGSSSSSSSASASSSTSDGTTEPVPPTTTAAGDGAGTLSVTGTSVLGVLVAGLSAVALGAFLLIVAKRRSS